MADATSGRAENPLFRAGDDWWNNACLNYASDTWGLYLAGYREAAEALIEHVQERRGTLDSLVLPTVFLYRQYLELMLKRIIGHGHRLLGERTGYPHGHDIKKLWDVARKVIED